jgi:hypothetical protein
METGEFEEIPVSGDLPELSWPSGIALDPKRRILILLGRGGNFVFFPDAWAWRKLNGLERLGFRAAAYDPGADAFRGLLVEPVGKGMKTLVTFSDQGAVMERKELSPPIPFDSHSDPPVQMVAAGDGLLVLISARFAGTGAGEEKLEEARLFRVNLESGAVVDVAAELPEEEVRGEGEEPGISSGIEGSSGRGSLEDISGGEFMMVTKERPSRYFANKN